MTIVVPHLSLPLRACCTASDRPMRLLPSPVGNIASSVAPAGMVIAACRAERWAKDLYFGNTPPDVILRKPSPPMLLSGLLNCGLPPKTLSTCWNHFAFQGLARTLQTRESSLNC